MAKLIRRKRGARKAAKGQAIKTTYFKGTYHLATGGEIGPALEAHEQVHCDRQGRNPDGWWNRYLSDIKFRLDEEVLAHKAEYETAIRLVPNRQSRRAHLKIIAKRLSGSLDFHLYRGNHCMMKTPI